MPSSPSPLRHYIGGKFVAGEKRFADVSSVDGRVLGEACEAGRDEVDRAVAAAKAAQSGAWGRISAGEAGAPLIRPSPPASSRERASKHRVEAKDNG